MKCLTVKAPWTWAIFHAGKNIENRSQKTHYRGSLLIHTSGSCTKQKWLETQDYVTRLGKGLVLPELKDIPHGYLYGIVDIVDCTYSQDGDGAWGMRGYYHWKLANPRLVVQLPYLGRLGLWEVPDKEVYTQNPLSSVVY